MCAGIHCMYQMCKTGHVPSLCCDDINIVLMPLTVGIFCCLRTNSPIMICSAESTSTNNRGDGSDKGLPAGPPDCTLHVTCMSVAQHMAVMGSFCHLTAAHDRPPYCSAADATSLRQAQQQCMQQLAACKCAYARCNMPVANKQLCTNTMPSCKRFLCVQERS